MNKICSGGPQKLRLGGDEKQVMYFIWPPNVLLGLDSRLNGVGYRSKMAGHSKKNNISSRCVVCGYMHTLNKNIHCKPIHHCPVISSDLLSINSTSSYYIL